jgi:hypothetical protein
LAGAHQPLPFFDEENEVSLCAHQALRRSCAVEVSRDQLLDFTGLKPDVAPEPGDVAIEQNQLAVHRSLRAKIMRWSRAAAFGFWGGRVFALSRSWIVGSGSLPPAALQSATSEASSFRIAISRSADSVQSRSLRIWSCMVFSTRTISARKRLILRRIH